MKKIHVILLTLFVSFVTIACSEDEYLVKNGGSGKEVKVELQFNVSNNIDVNIHSRVAQTPENEKRLYNIYLMIFDSQGNRIYGQLFDLNNLNETSKDDYWTTNSEFSAGTLHITTIARTGCTIYAVTNVSPNADMINVSPERLRLMRTQDDLEVLIATMNQKVNYRTGRFVMSGKMESVDTEQMSGTLQLTRLDAKITFNVACSTDLTFDAQSWQVFNMPTSSYLYGKENDCDNREFFDSPETNFETVVKDKSGSFAFYMLENRYVVAPAPDTKLNREQRNKNADGTNGSWTYAPETATYVILKGHLRFKQDNRWIDADVRYLIHLGDFNNNLGNYEVERNTSYTYTVTIKGVNHIDTEVSDGDENAPGATGNIIEAKEGVVDCDAHYVSQVLTFDVNNITPEMITWYVRTPFGEGQPKVVNGVDDPTGLDYKWVHFIINEKEGTTYKTTKSVFKPEKCLDVIEVVDTLKRHAAYYRNNEEHMFGSDDKISITAFIDEYYYEKHPITGRADSELWREFVNQPQRVMHILTDIKISPDGESSKIESAYSIQQYSIQSIYNVSSPNLHSAWGGEVMDESDIDDYYVNNNNNNGNKDIGNKSNTDLYNGRLNSCKLWELCDASGNTFKTGADWSTYLDLENSTLKQGYRGKAYSCLQRNRDNNGDGKIDENEIRWYTASIRQLIGLWMGADALLPETKLYSKTPTQSDFMQFVASSTIEGSDSEDPLIIWAHEGCSTGNWSGTGKTGNPSLYTVRCVRNLGYSESSSVDMTNVHISEYPEDYCITINNGDGSYTFSFERMNKDALRYYTSNELELAHETSVQNRLYEKFETAPDNSSFSSISFVNMNNDITTKGTNSYCPKGYRLPNQRELTIMKYYQSDLLGNNVHLTRTSYSLGNTTIGGKGWENKNGFHHNRPWTGQPFAITLTNGNATLQRCVRDVDMRE